MKFVPKKYQEMYATIYALWQDYEAFAKDDEDDVVLEIQKIITKKYKGDKHVAQLCKHENYDEYPFLWHLIQFIEMTPECEWMVSRYKYNENDFCGNCSNLTYDCNATSCKMVNDIVNTVTDVLPIVKERDYFCNLSKRQGSEYSPYKNKDIYRRHALCKTLCSCKYLQRR